MKYFIPGENAPRHCVKYIKLSKNQYHIVYINGFVYSEHILTPGREPTIFSYLKCKEVKEQEVALI